MSAFYTKVQPIHFRRTQILIAKGIAGTSENGQFIVFLSACN